MEGVKLLSLACPVGISHNLCIYLHRFQHFTGHIMTGSFVGRGNQYKVKVKLLYCKLKTTGK